MNNEQIKIIWIDDEIDLLKPHILFLEKKGYTVFPINNGYDALEEIQNQTFDLVLLDENMPGLSGLETLQGIKKIKSSIPVVMVTKNETEDIMEEAIGAHITDYLIKPVNPNQILLTLKRLLHGKNIVKEKTTINYQQEFRNIAFDISQARDHQDWAELYKKLVQWEIELEKIDNSDLLNILQSQKTEANGQFFKFIQRNYTDWFTDDDKPILSHTAFDQLVKPTLNGKKTVLLMIDNLRYDQWQVIKPLITPYYNVKEEHSYYSILPTATQYARNSFFAGMMPLEIEKRYPQYWKNDTDDGKKNDFEHELFNAHLKHIGQGNLNTSYHKILNVRGEKKLVDDFHSIKQKDIAVIVYNFIDILSHARTDNKIIKQMIRGDKTYRSVTYNWFENSHLLEFIKMCAQEKLNLVITTDHGTIFVKDPSKVIGDRETSTNLRYKLGRNLQYDKKDVLVADYPEDFHLPKVNISSKYIFAKEDLFLAYPNNYNHFVNYYKNTYQHGGISLEEMIIPLTLLEAK
ncbi:alginate biosynthesis transcriptional regulatory protein AlgB [Flavobacteriaceae bacterium UJ101]|nr:alginate biosynthesis transcriptional regulatory protein AlgB [Flavobacteriaceae bacterium UJ101]